MMNYFFLNCGDFNQSNVGNSFLKEKKFQIRINKPEKCMTQMENKEMILTHKI